MGNSRISVRLCKLFNLSDCTGLTCSVRKSFRVCLLNIFRYYRRISKKRMSLKHFVYVKNKKYERNLKYSQSVSVGLPVGRSRRSPESPTRFRGPVKTENRISFSNYICILFTDLRDKSQFKHYIVLYAIKNNFVDLVWVNTRLPCVCTIILWYIIVLRRRR